MNNKATHNAPSDKPDAMLAIALGFAKLEILELQAGRRTLLQCPGIENVAKAIQEAKAAAL